MMTLVSRTTRARSLRGDALTPLLASILADDIYGVLFPIPALARVAPDLIVQRFVFPQFQALVHIPGDEVDRVLPLPTSLFLKMLPHRRLCKSIRCHSSLILPFFDRSISFS